MKLKKVLMPALLMALTAGLAGCNEEEISPLEQAQKEVYAMYQADGGTQTYEEWLAEIAAKGEKGDKGDKGDAGEKGDKGDKGDAGKSAYEAYKEANPDYEGTEAQWLIDLANGDLATRKIEVTYNYGNAAAPLTQNYSRVTRIAEPEEPTSPWAEFAGWYTEDGDQWSFSKDVVAQDTKLVAHWNSKVNPIDGVSIYAGNGQNVELGQYTLAFDETGKLVFASRTEDGYGGPADGFYHDGTYEWKAGEQCGLFTLGEEFAPWPATTESGENAWGQYSVNIPSNWLVLTGNDAKVAAVYNKLFGTSYSSFGGNIFETNINDGALNDFKVTLKDGELQAVESPVADKVFISYRIASSGFEVYDSESFTKITWSCRTQEDIDAGTYQWGHQNYGGKDWKTTAIMNADGEVLYAVYNPSAGYGGATGQGFYCNPKYTDYANNPAMSVVKDGDGNVTSWEIGVPEGGFAIVASGDENVSDLIKMVSGGQRTTKGYDFNARNENWSDARVVRDGNSVYAYVNNSGLLYSGTNVGKFEKNAETGKYEGTMILPSWGSVSFKVIEPEKETVEIDYNDFDITFEGAFADDYDSRDYNSQLYQDGTAFWTETGGIYTFTYDPETMTLTAAAIFDNNAKANNFVVAADGKISFEATLSTWNSVDFRFMDAEGNVTALSSANGYAFAGDIIDNANCDWSKNLYTSTNQEHMQSSYTYDLHCTFEYDPATKTMTVATEKVA